MILKCPNCGEQYEVKARGNLDGFTMECTSCGSLITADDEVKITHLQNNTGWVTPIKKKSHSRWKWALTFFVLLIAVMALTKPSREKHEEKCRELCMGAYTQQMGTDDNSLGLAFLFGPYVMNQFMEIALKVDNYFIFNIGRVEFDDVEKTMTLGIFNNVIPLVSVDKEGKAKNKDLRE